MKLAILILLGLFCTIVVAQDTDDLDQLIARKKLILALPNLDQPPCFTNKNGKLQGYAIDLANDIANQLGISLEIKRSENTFDGAIDLVANKKADIVLGCVSKTTNRAKKILFTNPESIFYQTILVDKVWLAQNSIKSSSDNPEQIINTPNCKLGVLSKSSYSEWSKKIFPKATIIEYPNIKELDQALIDKKINALFIDDLIIKTFLLKTPKMVLHFSAIILKNRPDFVAIGVSQKNWLLWYWLNQYLEIRNEPTNADMLLQNYHALIS